MMIAVTCLIWWISRSRTGYYLHAIRQDEDAAEAVGIDTRRYKLIAVTLSAALTGAGGTFYAEYSQYVVPDDVLSVGLSVEIILRAIIGGSTTVLGPVSRLLHTDAGRRGDPRAILGRRLRRSRGQAVRLGCGARSRSWPGYFAFLTSGGGGGGALMLLRRHPDLHLSGDAQRRHTVVPQEAAGVTHLLEAKGVTVRLAASSPSTASISTSREARSSGSSVQTAPGRRRSSMRSRAFASLTPGP